MYVSINNLAKVIFLTTTFIHNLLKIGEFRNKKANELGILSLIHSLFW
jgi:hypothetical protein